MTWAHIHLVTVHLPLVGMALCFVLLVLSVMRRSAELRQVALIGIFLSGIAVYPIGFAGEQAEEFVEELSGIDHHQLEEHEESGELAVKIAIGVGLLSGLTALCFCFGLKVSHSLLYLTMAGVISALFFMGLAASEGARMRHAPEIDTGPGLFLPA